MYRIRIIKMGMYSIFQNDFLRHSQFIFLLFSRMFEWNAKNFNRVRTFKEVRSLFSIQDVLCNDENGIFRYLYFYSEPSCIYGGGIFENKYSFLGSATSAVDHYRESRSYYRPAGWDRGRWGRIQTNHLYHGQNSCLWGPILFYPPGSDRLPHFQS